MTNIDLAVLVQKLAEHNCCLMTEWNGREFTATAFKEMRYDIIRAHAQSLDGALALMAEAVEKLDDVEPPILDPIGKQTINPKPSRVPKPPKGRAHAEPPKETP